MLDTSAGTSSTATSRDAAASKSATLLCTWKEGSYGACWVHLAGELDLTTSLQLRYTLAEAQRHAFLLVLDLRELSFIDVVGIRVILDAVGSARREGSQFVLVRGPAQVESVFNATEARAKLTIIDLPPIEPGSALLDLE